MPGDHVYDAQRCYETAKAAEQFPFNMKNSKKINGKEMLKRSLGCDRIEFTSPLYLANMMLCRGEKDHPENHHRPVGNKVTFKVFELDDPQDEIVVDSYASPISESSNQSFRGETICKSNI